MGCAISPSGFPQIFSVKNRFFLYAAPAERGTRTAAGVFAPNGREVFRLKSSGELRSAERGSVPRPAAGAKRKDNLRFSFLFGLRPFPCFLIWRRFPICDRSETGVRQSGYRSVSFSAFSQFTDSVLLHMRFILRRRGMTMPRNSLTRYTARHLRM